MFRPQSQNTGGSLPTYGSGRRLASGSLPSGATGDSKLRLVLNVLLRPVYILARRGPLPVLLMLAVVVFCVYSFNSAPSPSAIGAKLGYHPRVVEPTSVTGVITSAPHAHTVPAAAGRPQEEAIEFRNRAGPGREAPEPVAPYETVAYDAEPTPDEALDEALLQQEIDRAEAARRKALRPGAALPPVRRDSRIPIIEGEPHPIPLLVKEARAKWDALRNRQSRTLKEAVAEYVRRHNRRPPKGFDQWYAFARHHDVQLIDEFDLIETSLLKFRAFRPSVFRDRVEQLTHMEVTWIIRIENGRVIRDGQLKDHDRAKGVESLLSKFVHLLPDMVLVYNGHDNARISLAAEERERLEGLARRGEYDDSPAPFDPIERGPEPHWGIPIFCPAGSAVREPGFDYGWPPKDSTGREMPPREPGTLGTFVRDFKGYMNVCESPQYRHYHCNTAWVYTQHPTPVLPLFTPGVQTTAGDIHAIIVEQLELEAAHDPTWSERPFNTLQWRGQTSGPLWVSNTPWRSTQRARLHLLSHEETGSREIVVTDANGLCRVEDAPNYRLNSLFLDTGMVGPAVQCVKEDGTCDEMYTVFDGYDKRMSFDRAALFKYVLDVDGNSWSGRFRRLMLSNAAVVKATIFPEFWTDWAVAWLHFIPIQVDYSDMWDVMAFFRGDLDGKGAHDDLANEIAQNGKEWVKKYYRWADLEAYQYRLLLEYARLFNDGDMDYTGDGSEEPVWSA